MKKKPTRRDLLAVIGTLQNYIGLARAVNQDRNPNQAAQVNGLLDEAHEFCIDVLSHDPPVESLRNVAESVKRFI